MNILIDSNKHEVFIMQCPANFPLVFASHPWFVCNEKGNVSRWEVLFEANKDENWGHLHLNRYMPFSGIEIFNFSTRWHWQSKLLKKIEGETAKEMIDFIGRSKKNYPHSKNYSVCGKNSNTYAQWVLDYFPEIAASLPWNAFGKNVK